MSTHFIPPKPTIEELENKAKDCEKRAEQAEEPDAAALRDEAKRYRYWAMSLKSGRWTA